MIVQALPQFGGQSVNVNFNGKAIELKFNAACQVEVKDELGKYILETYSSFLFDPNKKEEKAETFNEKVSGEVITRLNNELTLIKDELTQVKSQKKEVENDCQSWKDKVVELESVIVSLNSTVEEEKIATKKTIEDCDFKISLYELTDAKLKKLCVDGNLPKEEWEPLLQDKSKLINYIISKK